MNQNLRKKYNQKLTNTESADIDSVEKTSDREGCVKMPVLSDPWVKNNRLYGQNFKRLRASNLKAKSLFEDPFFPPEVSSLSYSGNVEGDAARGGKGEVGMKTFLNKKNYFIGWTQLSKKFQFTEFVCKRWGPRPLRSSGSAQATSSPSPNW